MPYGIGIAVDNDLVGVVEGVVLRRGLVGVDDERVVRRQTVESVRLDRLRGSLDLDADQRPAQHGNAVVGDAEGVEIPLIGSLLLYLRRAPDLSVVHIEAAGDGICLRRHRICVALVGAAVVPRVRLGHPEVAVDGADDAPVGPFVEGGRLSRHLLQVVRVAAAREDVEVEIGLSRIELDDGKVLLAEFRAAAQRKMRAYDAGIYLFALPRGLSVDLRL